MFFLSKIFLLGAFAWKKVSTLFNEDTGKGSKAHLGGLEVTVCLVGRPFGHESHFVACQSLQHPRVIHVFTWQGHLKELSSTITSR